MKGMCRNYPSRSRGVRLTRTVLRHARIVTDPQQLAHLRAEAARQKLALVPRPPDCRER
jgi:hypothetical protein